MWLESAVGLVPFLRGDGVLWVRGAEVVRVSGGGLGILEVQLGRDCSLSCCEGGVGLLIRDDGHIIGRKPSAFLTEQTVPPS